MNTIDSRYKAITRNIREACQRYEREPDTVCLLAVSKGHSASAIAQLYKLGQRQFGESYLHEALEKQQQLTKLNIDWHYIGRIQSNKAAAIAQHFSWVHSVDRIKIARRLNDQRALGVQRGNNAPPLNICLQINLNRENSKGGVNESNALALAQEIATLPNLKLRGLMALPQQEADLIKQRQTFARLRQLRDDLRSNGLVLDALSMGMSNDYVAAIAEDSTHLRIGNVLFGSR